MSAFHSSELCRGIERAFCILLFARHETFSLVWHVGNEAPCYWPSVGPEPADVTLQECFLITAGFQLLSWLSVPCCQDFSPCAIAHNLSYGLIFISNVMSVALIEKYWQKNSNTFGNWFHIFLKINKIISIKCKTWIMIRPVGKAGIFLLTPS